MTAPITATLTLDATTHAAIIGTSLVIASSTEAISLYVDPATDPEAAAATLSQLGRTVTQLRDVFLAATANREEARIVAADAAVVPAQRVRGES